MEEEKAGLEEVAKRARAASNLLAAAPRAAKDAALLAAAQQLELLQGAALEANRSDVAAAEAAGLPMALQKRLLLDEGKLRALVQGLKDVGAGEDPVGKVSLATRLAPGLDLFRVTCPIGVLCVIFGELVVQFFLFSMFFFAHDFSAWSTTLLQKRVQKLLCRSLL